MVIQSYNVKASSQRTFLSVQSTTMLATRNLQPSQIPANTQQGEDQVTLSAPSVRRNGHADRNQNNRGQNDQGQNNNSQGQNNNSQGQNVNNQGGNQNTDLNKMLKGIRDESHRRLARGAPAFNVGKKSKSNKNKLPSDPQELKAKLVQMMLELLTGKGSQSGPVVQSDNNEDRRRGLDIFSSFGGIFGSAPARAQGVEGWNVEHFQYESETVSYQAQGVIHTADGRTINIDINMHMSRQFVSYMNIAVETTRPIDPLVINYGGTAASLMGDRFQFDLTSDGNLDSLAVLGEGSGFLAVDWNGNGKIDDGSELFGPNTGCGFSELRKYDTDNNGWIDENDEIFDKLVVWRRDKDGNDTVYTLKELGIGAIYLGDIETEFSFKDENNGTLGVMRSTSFFVKECGGAGTVSHIDMMI